KVIGYLPAPSAPTLIFFTTPALPKCSWTRTSVCRKNVFVCVQCNRQMRPKKNGFVTHAFSSLERGGALGVQRGEGLSKRFVSRSHHSPNIERRILGLQTLQDLFQLRQRHVVIIFLADNLILPL